MPLELHYYPAFKTKRCFYSFLPFLYTQHLCCLLKVIYFYTVFLVVMVII